MIGVRYPHPSILVPGTTDGRPTYSPSCVLSGSAVRYLRLPSRSRLGPGGYTGSNALLLPVTIPSSPLVRATSPVYIQMILLIEETPLTHAENC